VTTSEAVPRQARDVMAFGQEAGRVLSDGRVVGRAEPFAKIFQSSRLVKQAVGLTAWGILEDIALDATLDVEGRLVAETNARRIAANLNLNKETVSRHLARLREFGFVLHEEVRHRGTGRYETARYVLDPSACLERFTTTPRRQPPRSEPCTENPVTVKPVSGRPVHGRTGHGESVHQEQDVVVEDPEEEQQQQTPANTAELVALGIDADLASALAGRYSPARVHDVAQAARRQARRNPAGWAIRALEGGWAISGSCAAATDANPARGWHTPAAPTDDSDEVEQRWQAWDLAVSAALDDEQLGRAVTLARSALPPASRIGPAVRTQLIRWAAKRFVDADAEELHTVLRDALETDQPKGTPGPVERDLPAPPVAVGTARPLRQRIAVLLPTSASEGGQP
jgi:hypothetical protein